MATVNNHLARTAYVRDSRLFIRCINTHNNNFAEIFKLDALILLVMKTGESSFVEFN